MGELLRRQGGARAVSSSSRGSSMGELNFKVVLLGEGSVGKTSCVLRYCRDEFNDKHITTIQASFFSKRITVSSARVKLAIWDTAGQERYAALGPIYYRDANGAMLVYDITDRQSFDRVKQWVKELRKMKGDCVLVICGNKIDLERQRTVTEKEAEDYAASVGAQHFNTSAKLNKGLEDTFVGLTRLMMEAFPEGGGANKSMALSGAGPGVDSGYSAEKTDGGCNC